jgi:F-type H+-transporting ATPase subunit delta
VAARGVAKRYAQAVFDLALESGTEEAWLGDLTTLANAAEDSVVGEFFTSPSVPEERKQAAAEQLLPGTERQLARNLAFMLISRRRFEILPDMLEVYRDRLLESRGIAIADVTTAVELTPAEQERVREQLSRLIGKQIELRPRVDPALIGGLVARVGDRLIDGSVVSQLRSLRSALAA